MRENCPLNCPRYLLGVGGLPVCLSRTWLRLYRNVLSLSPASRVTLRGPVEVPLPLLPLKPLDRPNMDVLQLQHPAELRSGRVVPFRLLDPRLLADLLLDRRHELRRAAARLLLLAEPSLERGREPAVRHLAGRGSM